MPKTKAEQLKDLTDKALLLLQAIQRLATDLTIEEIKSGLNKPQAGAD